MKNAEQPISPCMMQQVGNDSFRASKPNDPKEYNKPMAGLTKREYFAGLAMQGLVSDFMTLKQSSEESIKGNVGSITLICEDAVTFADELLKELEK